MPTPQRRMRKQRQDARRRHLLMPVHRSIKGRRLTPRASFSNWSERALILPILARCCAMP
ncbi:hypothetical protein BZK31_00045 [Pseudomonas floridensis]|uniref:Uncharacterized protein n=1 Tax=Pseudomonas floridensis TaxID=1958950 RepID=A0A1X0NCW0_9PSED|nr:hypothetical protein BZK31_00045 [Pseudomonas floridensis]